jgi:hypothetical protein
MKQALEALEFEASGWEDVPPITREAITTLRKALETEQEPVAWDGYCVLGHCGSPAGCEASNCCRADYTTPPKREWVELTDEEIITHFQTNVDTGSLLSFADGARYAEAKLKEKNT